MFTKSLRGLGKGFYAVADKWENRQPWSHYSWVKLLFGFIIGFPCVGVIGIVRGYITRDALILAYGIAMLAGGSVFATYFYIGAVRSERERDRYERRQAHPVYAPAVSIPEI